MEISVGERKYIVAEVQQSYGGYGSSPDDDPCSKICLAVCCAFCCLAVAAPFVYLGGNEIRKIAAGDVEYSNEDQIGAISVMAIGAMALAASCCFTFCACWLTKIKCTD